MPSAGLPLHKEGAHWQTGRAGGQILWDPGPCAIPLARLHALAHWALGRLRLHKVLMGWSRTAVELCHLAHYACPGSLGSP